MVKRARPATVSLRTEESSAYSTARLVITSADGDERSVVLGLSHMRIGSDDNNDVVLTDPHVSGCHCEIRKTTDGYVLRDLGSTNGTSVGDLIVKEGLLQSGALITVGHTKIRFVTDDGRIDDVVVSPRTSFGEVVGRSLRMREMFAVLERVARTDLTVLIGGETGSGKDLLARAIHDESERADAPFEVFDCGAAAPSLIESSLFGHRKGAFTGANENRDGAFVRAAGGTLFLDEVGELSLELQPKLLRVLEQRQVRPVGGDREISADVRILAATHRDLEHAVRDGKFRQDLFFRLSVVSVFVPPLRQRIEDLSAIVERILSMAPKKGVMSPAALAILEKYQWPGNVRELRNVVETAAAVSTDGIIEPEHLVFFRPQKSTATEGPGFQLAGKTLEEVERAAIEQTLKRCDGNKTRAAKALGISASTLYEKLKRYALDE